MTSAIQILRDQVAKELQGSVTIVVLGASGDLAKKKTYPALFGLYRNGFLPENTHIVGYARTKMEHDDYLKRITQYIKVNDAEKLEEFKKITSYVSGHYDDDASYQNLDKYIQESESKRGIDVKNRNRVFYMALPPSVFIPVAKGLKRNVYSKEAINRLVVEKPFGMDSESSAHLAHELG
ncbi:Glucose-6-phosphate 1-dehydrogenase, partial [Choanephora cucurbitarum]